MYVFLDESGDLGFNFDNKKSSRFFVISLLLLNNSRTMKVISKAVSKTLSNKINHKKKCSRIEHELKGSKTSFEVKKYFLNQLLKHSKNWSLYAIILDKKELLKYVHTPIKDRIYNHMSHQLLEKAKIPQQKQINLIIDRSKNRQGVKEFDDYINTNLSLCLDLETKLYITHDNSIKQKGIQAVDMFCSVMV